MSIRPIAMRDAFLGRICDAMALDPAIYFTTADFGSPVLDRIRGQFPDRFANVGIAEQNLINVSAGLAIEGYKVFAYAIAPFITMRCFEQIRVNLALLSKVRSINVNLIGVGAGYSYVVSGPTHQCYEDLTVMRALPNVAVYSPSDHVAAAALFDPCLANASCGNLHDCWDHASGVLALTTVTSLPARFTSASPSGTRYSSSGIWPFIA